MRLYVFSFCISISRLRFGESFFGEYSEILDC